MNKGKTVVVDYENIKPLDIVLTGGRGFFAGIIRLVTGGKNRSVETATHAGLVYESRGQLYIAEMKLSGLQINSLEEYNRGNKRHYLIALYRCASAGVEPAATEALNGIAIDRRKTIDYDFKGDVNFVFKSVRGTKEAYFCSEYVADLFQKAFGVVIPGTGKTGGVHGVSPADIQRWAAKNCEEIRYAKP